MEGKSHEAITNAVIFVIVWDQLLGEHEIATKNRNSGLNHSGLTLIDLLCYEDLGPQSLSWPHVESFDHLLDVLFLSHTAREIDEEEVEYYNPFQPLEEVD